MLNPNHNYEEKDWEEPDKYSRTRASRSRSKNIHTAGSSRSKALAYLAGSSSRNKSRHLDHDIRSQQKQRRKEFNQIKDVFTTPAQHKHNYSQAGRTALQQMRNRRNKSKPSATKTSFDINSREIVSPTQSQLKHFEQQRKRQQSYDCYNKALVTPSKNLLNNLDLHTPAVQTRHFRQNLAMATPLQCNFVTPSTKANAKTYTRNPQLQSFNDLNRSVIPLSPRNYHLYHSSNSNSDGNPDQTVIHISDSEEHDRVLPLQHHTPPKREKAQSEQLTPSKLLSLDLENLGIGKKSRKSASAALSTATQFNAHHRVKKKHKNSRTGLHDLFGIKPKPKPKLKARKQWKEHDAEDGPHEQTQSERLYEQFDYNARLASKLLLPSTTNLLVKKFQALETTMTMYMRKNQFFVRFEDIQSSVQMILKRNFLLSDLQKMLYIMPAFFILQWTELKNVQHKSYTKFDLSQSNKNKSYYLTLTSINFDLSNVENLQQLLHGFDGINHEQEENNDNSATAFRHILDDHKQISLQIGGKRFMKVSVKKLREKVFKYRLFQFVSKQHSLFLNKHSLLEHNPLKYMSYNKRFDLETDCHINNISLFPLPSKPKKQINKVQNMINEQEQHINQVVQNEVEKINQNRYKQQQNQNQHQDQKEYEQKELEDESARGLRREKSAELLIPDHMKHLSPSIIAKARARKQLILNNNMTAAASKLVVKGGSDSNLNAKAKGNTLLAMKDDKLRWSQMPYMANLMRTTYVSLKKRSMPYKSLVSVLKRKHKNCLISDDEIRLQLDLLVSLKCKFFEVKRSISMKIAKCNYKRVDMNLVMREINQRVNGT